MKKLVFIVAIALLVVGCKKNDYKAMGEQYASRLSELCQKNDTAAALALNDSIRIVEAEIESTGDTAGLNAFRKAMFDARQQCSAFITVAKIDKGASRQEAVQEVIDNAMNGEGDVSAVTSAIQASIDAQKKKAQEKKAQK